jgi:hypothetical protein
MAFNAVPITTRDTYAKPIRINPKTVSFTNTFAGAFMEWSNSCFIGLNFNTGFSKNIAAHKIERETGSCNVFLLKYTPHP